MNKKKKIIIITITAVIVIIAGIIVGISVNKHNVAVKEALSVSESKEDVCNSFNDEFKEIVDKEYNTAEEYESAKDTLVKIKDRINRSDIKEDERLTSLISDIDKTIAEYDNKITDLTTTTTTEITTEVENEETTEKPTKPVNATTTKSSSSSSKTTTRSNNSNNTTRSTTKAQTTTKQTTTTAKSYDPAPAYGTVKYSNIKPNGNYKINHWCYVTLTYTWDSSKEYWNGSINYTPGSLSHTPCNVEDLYYQATKSFSKPNRDGKYDKEEVSKSMWIWN